MQSELFLERLAQYIIVVDDENAYYHAFTCHAGLLPARLIDVLSGHSRLEKPRARP
jgi:hypothetical protein